MALPLRYNWRNLFVRKSSTLLTFGVVATIVFTLTWALAFGEGMRQSLNRGGADDTLIVIKPGATGESTSIITREEFDLLTQLNGLASDAAGEMLRSGEVCTQVNMPRLGGPAGDVPVAVRGVDPIAFAVHKQVRIVQGRNFEPGTNELIVGKAIGERVQSAGVGDELALGYLGTRTFKVVGVFEAAGGPLESEVWGSRGAISDAFGRTLLSSVALGLRGASEAENIIQRIKGPPFQLNAKTERQYYRDIADKSSQIVNLTLILVVFMAFGACFAVSNTLYAAVDGRAREIAMLRTIGYSRAAVVWAFLLESMLLVGLACAAGAAGALCFQGQRQDFMAEATWSTFAYEMKVTPMILLTSAICAILVGAIGALAPAMRAARLNIITALRQA